jgi:hypothetical protein
LREKAKLNGENALAIRPALVEAAVQAESILEPWGLSLVEAAHIAAAIRKRESESRPLEEATAAWLIACDGLRPRTVEGYRHLARRLEIALAGRSGHRIAYRGRQRRMRPGRARRSGILARRGGAVMKARPIILLDLNYTLVANSPKHGTTPERMEKRLATGQYRQWLAELVRPYTVVLMTARPETWKNRTLDRIEEQTGWRPQHACFAPIGWRNPPAIKEHLLKKDISPIHGEDARYIAIESNPRTRGMYAH